MIKPGEYDIVPGEYDIILGIVQKGKPFAHMLTRKVHSVEIKFPVQGEGILAFLEETSDIIQGKVMEVAKENEDHKENEDQVLEDPPGARVQRMFRNKFKHRYGGAVPSWGHLSQSEKDLWAEVEGELC